jgi:Phosphatidylinositol-4-phosphate 5-Kinase
MARYLGLHRMVITDGGKKSEYYLIVMKNIFKTKKQLDYRFDLKGSTHGRKTNVTGLDQ